MREKKGNFYRGFDPGKYKMTCCPHCRGRGKSPHQAKGAKSAGSVGGSGGLRKGMNL